MKIVILDGYTENPGDLSWGGFEALGALTVYDRTPVDRIVERIGSAEAVIVNKTPIGRDVIEACPSIRYVGVLATGYNVVDVAACAQRGHRGHQHPDLRHRGRGQMAIASFWSCATTSGRTPIRCSRASGRTARTGATEISPGRARGQDHGHHRVRPHRAGDRPDRPGPGHEDPRA
jgi:hypothetical protein